MSYARSSAYFALAVTLFMSVASEARADSAALEAEVRKRAAAVEEKLIAWRRDIHQHPELGDQETRTAQARRGAPDAASGWRSARVWRGRASSAS